MKESIDVKQLAKDGFIEYMHNIDLDKYKEILVGLEYDLSKLIHTDFANNLNKIDSIDSCKELITEVSELIYRFEQLEKNDLKLYIEFSG